MKRKNKFKKYHKDRKSPYKDFDMGMYNVTTKGKTEKGK